LGQPLDVSIAQFAGRGFGVLKADLADVAVETLAPISLRYRELLEDRDELDRMLLRGEDRARNYAACVLADAYRALGL